MIRVTFVLALLLATGAPLPSRAGEARWFKGNTHTHSLWSDGNDFPEMIAAFYRDQGYHFLVLSDHNVLSRGEYWMNVSDVERRQRVPGPTALETYVHAFWKTGSS